MPLKKGNRGGVGNPALAGALSNDQLQQLWVANGGNPGAAPMAAAIALAESSGRQDAVNYNTNGSVDRGYWQINSIHGAQSTFDANGNARAAVSISNNGTDWSPWTTFGSGAYKQFLHGASAVSPSASGGGGTSTGSTSTGAGSPAQPQSFSLMDLITGDLDTLAAALGMVLVNITKDVFVGIFDYIVQPAWHWNQRAVDDYWTDILSNTKGRKGDAAKAWVATSAFWGIGYVLLWTDPDQKGFKPQSPHNAHVARHVRRLQALPARRELIKPKRVKESTPTKPKEITSRAAIAQVDTLRTSRTRTVRVTSANGDTGRNLSGIGNNSESERATESGTRVATEHPATAKPDANNHSRNGSPQAR